MQEMLIDGLNDVLSAESEIARALLRLAKGCPQERLRG
jgi:ferritin-like metal-binding protein YciE